MSRRTIRIITGAVLLVATVASTAWADKVRLRSGKIVEGTFIAADSKSVRLLLANGTRAEYPIADVAGVDFAARAVEPPAPPPNPVAKPAPVHVPGGTVINVRLTQGIDVDQSQAGMKFKAIVDDPVMLNGKVVIPRGAAATLQAAQVAQSGKMKGSDKITLKMNSIAFGGRVYEVATQYVETKSSGEGKKTARKVGGGLGLGAVVGGIAGGGTGAAIGAAVGGATGAIISSQGEAHLQIPAETRLQFQLSAAVAIQP
jgi:hypothetical protein